MTEKNFDRAFQFVTRWEGWSKADDVDPGGETVLGISERYHPREYREISRILEHDGRDAALEYARRFYHREYWMKTGADRLPAGYDLMVFDTAINIGRQRAVRGLQLILGVEPDGIVGPVTLRAAERHGRRGLYRYGRWRIHFYYEMTPKRYHRGLVHRVADLLLEVGMILAEGTNMGVLP